MIPLIPVLSALIDPGNDPELVRRLKNRDPEAMADLYDRYGRITYSLIYRIVRNAAMAEDLVQETFLRIWNRVHAFDEQKGSLSPWVLTVARNRAIDYLRSVDGRRRESVFELEKMEEPALFSNLENDIMNMDRAQILREAFLKLSENQRTVIELAYYEGLSQSEMAERLQQPLGTVKTWVRTALKTLRNEIEQAAIA
ncbi:MAG TPA: sigma-70 family RNA polymerase sigma factor [Bryobacteraceae bacterium]|nr:sigma-70 family RNA polymerase sigma factor [Bryobacteraceae bacterium]